MLCQLNLSYEIGVLEDVLTKRWWARTGIFIITVTALDYRELCYNNTIRRYPCRRMQVELLREDCP